MSGQYLKNGGLDIGRLIREARTGSCLSFGDRMDFYSSLFGCRVEEDICIDDHSVNKAEALDKFSASSWLAH